jgi:hypothetical protein
MDEALDAVELLTEFGLEGIVAWILRLVGLVALVAGLGLWLFTEMGLLFVPAALLVVGVVLLVAPSVLLFLTELT